MSYQTTSDFLRMFGYSSLEELPELPKYKLDENKQIVIDELVENQENEQELQEAQEEAKTKTENQQENQDKIRK